MPDAFDAALRSWASAPAVSARSATGLRAHEFDAQLVDRVIERLRRLELVDDAAFAEYWVEQRATHRPRGGRLLKQELRQKGVNQDVLAEACPKTTTRTAPTGLPSGRPPACAPWTSARSSSGSAHFLQRRGYGYETDPPVVGAPLQETAEQAEARASDDADRVTVGFRVHLHLLIPRLLDQYVDR